MHTVLYMYMHVAGFLSKKFSLPPWQIQIYIRKASVFPQAILFYPSPPPLNRQKHCGLLYLGLNELLVLLEERAYKESKILYEELLSI